MILFENTKNWFDLYDTLEITMSLYLYDTLEIWNRNNMHVSRLDIDVSVKK